MILTTKEDFEQALLKGEEIKTSTVFYTGDLDEKKDSLPIGSFDKKLGVYCGNFRGKDIWCSLHDSPKLMKWEDAVKWCVEQGGVFPDIDVLTWIYLNKDKINKALKKNGGDKFKDNNIYWSSTEYNYGYAWYVLFNTGFRVAGNKYSYVSVRPVLAL